MFFSEKTQQKNDEMRLVVYIVFCCYWDCCIL